MRRRHLKNHRRQLSLLQPSTSSTASQSLTTTITSILLAALFFKEGVPRLDALQAGLNTLPERQKQAVILRHIEGLSNPEIAEIMEVGIEAVESLTARGKRALAKALAGRKEELGYSDG